MPEKMTYKQLQQEIQNLKREASQLMQVKEALRESEEKYRDLVEDISDVVYAADHNGVITFISPVIENVAGYSPSEVVGRPLTDFIHPEDLSRVTAQFQKLISGQIELSEYRILKKSGEVCWVRASSQARLKDGHATIVRGVLRDISRPKQAEEELHHEFEMSLRERTAELLKINEGYRFEIVQRKKAEEAMRESAQRLQIAYDQATIYAEELKKEIADRKQVEQALIESEQRYRALWDEAPVAYHVVDTKGIIMQVNRTETVMLGYTQEEMVGKPIFNFILPEQRKEALKRFGLKLAGEEVSNDVDRVYVRKDGSRVHVSIDDVLERTKDGEIISVRTTMVDITKRRQAERALQHHQEELKAQSRSLEEVNTALKVLLKHREEDMAELEQKVVSNVKDLILPYVETVGNTRLDARQKAYVSIIESNLNEIISPFLRNLSSRYLRLTPKEIQIADLIKHGKTTKEMAELLNMSTRAVRFHRENIRTKLGLKNKPANLRTHLASLSGDIGA